MSQQTLNCGKFNDTPKSSVSTDTEVYFINYHNIHHGPQSSIDESIISDNDGYDTEKHVRVIRQVSSDTYCSDNCFYSDSETHKIPDVITHDNTTSNILYEMCDTLNKVPDILSGNVDSTNCQKDKPCRYSDYSGTSSSSFFSGDTSPNWSPNSTKFKQRPDVRNHDDIITPGNDMTDTDSIIYHNVEDVHVVGDAISTYDNVSRKSINFMNSTIDLFNSKTNKVKESPIILDNLNMKDNEILEYPINIVSNESLSKISDSNFFINLDALNELHFAQMDQDIDHEISTLLSTECPVNMSRQPFKTTEKNSTFYEYNPRRLDCSDVTKTFGEKDVINENNPNETVENNETNYYQNIIYSDKPKFFKNYNNHNEKYLENKHISKKRKNSDVENMDINSGYFFKENLKSYNLSESSSAPNIFGQNKKYRYSTSSLDEGSDYDPEISFHKFSKSISNVSLHEYGQKVLREKQSKIKNSREELKNIEKTVGRMLEQVRLHENLLQNDVTYKKFSLIEQEKKTLPILFNLHASSDKVDHPYHLNEVPINCNRQPLKYKYETKNDLNLATSSNVSSACSIEDLERSVNKLLSDVEKEESKLNLSQLGTYHSRKMESPKLFFKHIKGTEVPSSYHTSEAMLMENRIKDYDLSRNNTAESKPSTSHQRNHYFKSTYSASDTNRNKNNPYEKCNPKMKEDSWWEGAYQIDTLNDKRGIKRTKRSNKRATYWPHNPLGLDTQISYTPSSEEGVSSSSNSDSECNVLEKIKKKASINLNVKKLHDGRIGIEIETADVLNTQEYPNHSLNSLWNRSMPSLPSVGSESSFPSALSIRSSESEDCLSNLGYYQNLVIPKNCIEYITPAEIGLSDILINSGYCHWNFNDNEELEDLDEGTSSQQAPRKKKEEPSPSAEVQEMKKSSDATQK